MEIDQPLSKTNTERELSTAPEDTRTENGEKDSSEPLTTKKKPEREKVGHDMENMSRVLPAQLKYISFPGERYLPVKKVSSNHFPSHFSNYSRGTHTDYLLLQPTGGVILLHDTTPDEDKDLLELK